MRPTRRGRPRTADGFTLVELIIVVALLGIVVLAAMPQLVRSVDDARLRAVTSEIVTALQFAQSSAVGSGRSCRVTVDAAVETVLLEQVQYTKLADILNVAKTQLPKADIETSVAYATMKNPMKPGSDYRISFKAEPWFPGIDIVSVAFDAGGNLVYSNYGVPSTGLVLTLAYAGRQATVTVDATTGAVSVQ